MAEKGLMEAYSPASKSQPHPVMLAESRYACPRLALLLETNLANGAALSPPMTTGAKQVIPACSSALR